MIDFSNLQYLEPKVFLENDIEVFENVATFEKPVCQLNYFPPTILEQLNNSGDFYQTHLDSQWTLGAIFCELITGKHPLAYFDAFNWISKTKTKIENLNLLMTCHSKDYYLLDLPEQFNLDSLDLLQNLLRRDTEYRF